MVQTLIDNPCFFAAEPLDRASAERRDVDWVAARLRDPETFLLPLFEGDPLVVDGRAALLSAAALPEFGRAAPTVFLGQKNGVAYFAVDAAASGAAPEAAPFSDIGEYKGLREAAGALDEPDLSMVGQARWLLDWHARHRFCAVCGTPTEMVEGGAKRQCPNCGAEHFPRSDPVAIVLPFHGEACLLGRGPHFPPGFMSALAGYVEAAETPEECAVRELREEAGVTISNVRYQFSQPWPFPSSLMMGFFADAADRNLTLDPEEIEEARWCEKSEVISILNGEGDGSVFLPPNFTIARQLLERWVGG
ncbi:MAG: NAD(+) diphosphatase [Pseudomonadota bacterium]